MLLWLLGAASVTAQEKLVVLDDVPRHRGLFTVAPDGNRLFFAGDTFSVFDAAGRLVSQFGTPNATQPRAVFPLADSGYIAITSYAYGRVARLRPDGTEASVLVKKGLNEKQLRSDTTAWTSPGGGVMDPVHQRLFVIDTTMAPRDDRRIPDPDWSRIAMFDLNGGYIGDLNRYDAAAPDAKANDERRTWYRGIAVDPARQRVYVGAIARQAVLCFGYDGVFIGKVPATISSEFGGVAVLPDGRVAVTRDGAIAIHGPDLAAVATLSLPVASSVLALQSDAAGRLYASVNDRSILWIRWPADLQNPETIGPRYRRMHVSFATTVVTADQPFAVQVSLTGRPAPTAPPNWQVSARPSDGRDLGWQALAAEYAADAAGKAELQVRTPADWQGAYDVRVRFGDGPVSWANRAHELYVQRSVIVAPADATRSVTVISDTGRLAFRQGEAIALQVIRRTAETNEAVTVALDFTPPLVSSGTKLEVRGSVALELPAALTRRLLPGRYVITPSAAEHAAYPLALTIAPAEPDSPVQRIMYHEFGETVFRDLVELADDAERRNWLANWAAETARLGFTRETWRDDAAPQEWRRDTLVARLTAPALAPSEYYRLPQGGWQKQAYLDEATAHGLRVDLQLLGHCFAARPSPESLRELNRVLQQQAQSYGRYPAFYGFNYNDELFVNSPYGGLQQSDQDFFERAKAERFAGRPIGEVNEYVFDVMYESFNAAARAALPRLRTTTTPMWQYPAVEGSYPPAIYRGMDESYTHFLFEGYAIPWQPAHAVEFLRRPGKPVMGVFDNLKDRLPSERYVKNVLQVAARGVQGVGVQHTAPFLDPTGATAYQVVNDLVKMYGPVFAACPPANAGAILYSRTQDYTEKRNMFGTPHWERAFELFAAGLMAGVPLSVVYEEDLAAGWLVGDSQRVRVPMLFLVGQQADLPAPVRQAIAAYQAAGGTVWIDADSAPFPGARSLDLPTHQLQAIWHASYAADSLLPMCQPVLEQSAAKLWAAVGTECPFPVTTCDPWVSKNVFDGGAITYVMLVTETSPYPWPAGDVWSTGDMYNKALNAWLPKTVTLSLPPARRQVVYDVFERAVVRPTFSVDAARLTVDLTTFPGRLYAIAPRALDAPQLTAEVGADTIAYTAKLNLAARVPLRIRLTVGEMRAAELYRGTDARGKCVGYLPRPANPGPWTLEVTELLGGKTTAVAAIPAALASLSSGPSRGGEDAELPAPDGTGRGGVVVRPAVDFHRTAQLRALLTTNSLTLAAAHDKIVSPAEYAALAAALQKQGITLQPGPVVPTEFAAATYLVVGYVGAFDALLNQASGAGLLDYPLTRQVPGPGRGLITAVYAPRGFGENAIALVGGDAAGLATTVAEFVRWLASAGEPGATAVGTPTSVESRPVTLKGKPVGLAAIPRLSERVGVRLTGVTPAADGRHLLVTADGYLNNLLVIDGADDQPHAVRAARVGQAYHLHSPYLSPDGRWFGAAARTINRFGQGFHLFETARGSQQVFAGFGDMGRQINRFAVAADGQTLLATGPYGVVGWRREGDRWREAWAREYWKEFDKLDWPVSASAERAPQFHAVIPDGADYALILFGEFTNNGWITSENVCGVWLAAVDLADGGERWRFDVPVPDTLLLPTLHTSETGQRTLLQVQMGTWGKSSFRLFSVADGRALGTWDMPTAPISVALADHTGCIAVAAGNRLLEVRQADGQLLHNRLWPNQPVSLAFAADGKSLFVADDAGRLTRLGPDGSEQWGIELGSVTRLAAAAGRVYAAGWDGRVRSVTEDGAVRWMFDCTPAMKLADPMLQVAASATDTAAGYCQARRAPTTANTVPAGDNLLAVGQATLTVGGTGGWMSNGKVDVEAATLTNGQTDDVTEPWLNLDELFWNGQAGRQVFAEISFPQPTDVQSMTVYENPVFPDSWPTEGRVQVWREANQSWDTAAVGLFLTGPVNTYTLNLPAVTKLRYVPWNSYYRNFYTSEIEVR